MNDRSPAVVLEKFLSLYPGSRHEGRFVENISCENGGSFKAEFEAGCLKRGAKFRWAVPDTPATNSEAEYFHDGLERGSGAGLLQSGLPYKFWSRSARHYCFNFARTADGRDDPDGDTP